MRVCTTVFGYAGGQAVVDRHLPLWRAVSDEIVLVYPEDSPNTADGVRHYPVGSSNKYGEECIKRQLAGMRHSQVIPADYYVFVEYDAFLLRRPVARRGLQANAFRNKDACYRGPRFFHFPWIFDADSLRQMLAKAAVEPLEGGFVDRWLQCQIAPLDIPVHDFRRLREGYSRNTIQHPWERFRAVWLARRGGYAFHGVKDAALLNRIVSAFSKQR